MTHRGRRRPWRASLIATAAVGVAWVLPGAQASAGFSTGLLGRDYVSPNGADRAQEFDWTVEAKARVARIDVSWRAVAVSQPAQPASPADPGYDFSRIDDAVREAAARSLRVVLTVYRAPDYALGPDPPGGAERGTWRPQPDAFADFATALATRYSGGFGGLPAVRYYEAWNEPNLFAFLTPQEAKGGPPAPVHYRLMVNAFAGAIKAVSGQNRVIAGATAPYGDDSGGMRTRPLEFLRTLLCVKEKKGELRRAKCDEKPNFDILSHHPINLSGGPKQSAIDPDDASTPDFKHVKRTLRAAEKLNTVKGRHPVWATEIWWETDPPQPNGVSLKRHARWTAESLYVLWKQGAKVVINYIVRDHPPNNVDQTIDSGLIKANGTKKPAFAAFRFPFVVDRKRNGSLFAWGKAPAGGRAKIQRRAGKRWRTVASTRAGENKVFTKRFNGPRAHYRAKVGGDKSMAWRAPKG